MTAAEDFKDGDMGQDDRGEWRDTSIVHGARPSSFEKYLRSLPRVDAVDRTVDWVLSQPDNIEVHFESIPYSYLAHS